MSGRLGHGNALTRTKVETLGEHLQYKMERALQDAVRIEAIQRLTIQVRIETALLTVGKDASNYADSESVFLLLHGTCTMRLVEEHLDTTIVATLFRSHKWLHQNRTKKQTNKQTNIYTPKKKQIGPAAA